MLTLALACSQVSLSRGGDFTPTAWQTYLLFLALLIIHGTLNVRIHLLVPWHSRGRRSPTALRAQSVGTKILASMTKTFVFFNLGTVIAVIISLLVCTDNKNSASYVFTHNVNGSGWSSDGLAFLLGLLSVTWTMTGAFSTIALSLVTSSRCEH